MRPRVCLLAIKHLSGIGFEQVPAAFRRLVKDYTQTLLLVSGCSPAHCANEVSVLGAFLAFYLERHASATTLAELAAIDIDAWVAHLRATPNGRGRARTDIDLVDRLLIVQRLVRALERIDSPSAPTRPFARIFLPERLPRAVRYASQDRIKYIPASVLAQLDAAIARFEAPYLPVLLVLRASGWRISDVLSLRWDRCVKSDNDCWWLVGDIHKTRILGHRVPITPDVAAAMQVQIHAVRQGFSEAENPQRFLFPNSHPRRLGHPISPTVIRAALQRFVARCGITGPDGQPFRLHAHAFRHTKAVELINNGMGMAYVQHWLAHLSPEMTIVYARISEDTLRKQWEQAMVQGAVQIRAEGPRVIDPDEVIAGNELELAYIRGNLDATRVETGYCFKPLKMECPFVEIARFTCHNHVTTADFLPQFRHQEQDLVEQIDLGTAAGRPHWVEKNPKKLRAVQAIIAALEQQHVHGLTKAQREYGQGERARLDAERAARAVG
jgi:integrase